MPVMFRFRKSVRNFLKDESGVLLAEALILLPLLVWGFLALVVYWDVFRTINVTQKAAYSISDMISRQGVITNQFVDGLENVLSFLTPGAPASRMRVTSIEFDEGTNNQAAWDADDSFILLFSRSPGGEVPAHTSVTINETAFRNRIPVMSDLESVVIVETWVDYEPDFDVGVLNMAPGLTDQTFTQFIVTRPRNWRRVCLDGAVPGCV
jgi:Flp pilus assembly protein TadG